MGALIKTAAIVTELKSLENELARLNKEIDAAKQAPQRESPGAVLYEARLASEKKELQKKITKMRKHESQTVNA